MSFRPPPLLCATFLLAGLVACQREAVTVYLAPKDSPEAETTPAPEVPTPGTAKVDTNAPLSKRAELPKLVWTLPPGWVEGGPGQMSMANFTIKTETGQATVAVTPLSNMGGQEAMIVNMWRQQVGAEPLAQPEAEQALTPISIAGGAGKYFEIAAQREGKPHRIVTAMLTRGDKTWFFKLAGDGPVVVAQKTPFLEFVKTAKFEEKATAAVVKAEEEPPLAPEIQAPETWRELPAGTMQVAKYAVPDQGEAKAEVAVSMFPSEAGGTNANIARWCRQLGVEKSEAEAGAMAQPLEGVPGAVFAEIQKEKRRMIGAIVPRGGQWWFYKLMGDEAAVTAARESFLTFCKSQPKS